MVVGSLVWAGVVAAAWVILFVTLFLILNLVDWTQGKNEVIAKKITKAVTFNDEYPDRITETIMTFLHNVRTMILIYVVAVSLVILLPGSITTLIVPSLMVAAYTAINVGAATFVCVTVHQTKPKALSLFLVVALPHWITELPAIWLITGHSLWIAATSIFNLWGSLTIVGVWAALLVTAAIAETYVTPKVIDWALAKLKE